MVGNLFFKGVSDHLSILMNCSGIIDLNMIETIMNVNLCSLSSVCFFISIIVLDHI